MGHPGRVHDGPVSIGFAVADTAKADAAGLLRDADAAMYLAKKVPGSTSVMATGRQGKAVMA